MLYVLVRYEGKYEPSAEVMAASENKAHLILTCEELKERDEVLKLAVEEAETLATLTHFTEPEPIKGTSEWNDWGY